MNIARIGRCGRLQWRQRCGLMFMCGNGSHYCLVIAVEVDSCGKKYVRVEGFGWN